MLVGDKPIPFYENGYYLYFFEGKVNYISYLKFIKQPEIQISSKNRCFFCEHDYLNIKKSWTYY